MMIETRGLHVSSVLEQSLLGLKRTKINKNAAYHKEKCKAQMKINSIDRDRLRKYLVIFIAPSPADRHLQEIVHIHSEKLSTKEINVDSCKTVEKQLQQFISNLVNCFYKLLTAAVLSVKRLKKSIEVNQLEVIDTSFIYSRVVALQLTKEALKVENVSSFEFFPVLVSMFDDTVDMRSAKSKLSLNNTGKKVSFRSMKRPELVVNNGCTILWVVNWPTNGLVCDYIANYCDFVSPKEQREEKLL